MAGTLRISIDMHVYLHNVVADPAPADINEILAAMGDQETPQVDQMPVFYFAPDPESMIVEKQGTKRRHVDLDGLRDDPSEPLPKRLCYE